VVRSVIATPTLQGSPFSGPVVESRPPTEAAITSSPGLFSYGPVLQKPDIQQ